MPHWGMTLATVRNNFFVSKRSTIARDYIFGTWESFRWEFSAGESRKPNLRNLFIKKLTRDRVVPIVSLAERMGMPEQPRDGTASRLLVVLEAAGRITALEVDAIRDRLEVVLKPMQGLLAGARGYAGTTLLGNGEVLLVLDVKDILS